MLLDRQSGLTHRITDARNLGEYVELAVSRTMPCQHSAGRSAPNERLQQTSFVGGPAYRLPNSSLRAKGRQPTWCASQSRRLCTPTLETPPDSTTVITHSSRRPRLFDSSQISARLAVYTEKV